MELTIKILLFAIPVFLYSAFPIVVPIVVALVFEHQASLKARLKTGAIAGGAAFVTAWVWIVIVAASPAGEFVITSRHEGWLDPLVAFGSVSVITLVWSFVAYNILKRRTCA